MTRLASLLLGLLSISLGLIVFAPQPARAVQTSTAQALDASRQAAGCSGFRAPGEVAIIVHVNAQSGTVSVPELNLTASIADGCFEFRNLALPQDPMLITFNITADGFPPTTFAHYLVSGGTSGGPDITFTLHPGTEPVVIDPCPGLLAHPQEQSAVLQMQAELCAQVQLPATGTGVRAGDGTVGATALLLALGGGAGVTLAFALMVLRRHERADRSW